MSTFEIQQIAIAMDRQTSAMQELTYAINDLAVTNQKVLAALIDLATGDGPDETVGKDMDGNPV